MTNPYKTFSNLELADALKLAMTNMQLRIDKLLKMVAERDTHINELREILRRGK